MRKISSATQIHENNGSTLHIIIVMKIKYKTLAHPKLVQQILPTHLKQGLFNAFPKSTMSICDCHKLWPTIQRPSKESHQALQSNPWSFKTSQHRTKIQTQSLPCASHKPSRIFSHASHRLQYSTLVVTSLIHHL